MDLDENEDEECKLCGVTRCQYINGLGDGYRGVGEEGGQREEERMESRWKEDQKRQESMGNAMQASTPIMIEGASDQDEEVQERMNIQRLKSSTRQDCRPSPDIESHSGRSHGSDSVS